MEKITDKELIKKLSEIMEDNGYETTGEALEHFLNVCDNIPYCDWRVQDIMKTIDMYKEYMKIE